MLSQHQEHYRYTLRLSLVSGWTSWFVVLSRATTSWAQAKRVGMSCGWSRTCLEPFLMLAHRAEPFLLVFEQAQSPREAVEFACLAKLF